MRYTVLALISLAACPLFAQEPVRLPSAAEAQLQQALEVEMNRVNVGISAPMEVVALRARLAAARVEALSRPITASATDVIREEGFIHFRGNVQIRSGQMLIQADEADYDSASGEIAPRGNVRITQITR